MASLMAITARLPGFDSTKPSSTMDITATGSNSRPSFALMVVRMILPAHSLCAPRTEASSTRAWWRYASFAVIVSVSVGHPCALWGESFRRASMPCAMRILPNLDGTQSSMATRRIVVPKSWNAARIPNLTMPPHRLRTQLDPKSKSQRAECVVANRRGVGFHANDASVEDTAALTGSSFALNACCLDHPCLHVPHKHPQFSLSKDQSRQHFFELPDWLLRGLHCIV